MAALSGEPYLLMKIEEISVHISPNNNMHCDRLEEI